MLETLHRRQTLFGSIDSFRKGDIQLVTGSQKDYVFSNVYEVASRAKPYEKVVVAKNLEYVQEAIRAEGVSPWYACSHDEFVICMDGEVRIDFVKLNDTDAVAPRDAEGTVALTSDPEGRKMGYVTLRKGHQALLPRGAAYRYTAAGAVSVLLQQTIFGKLSIERWSEICYR